MESVGPARLLRTFVSSHSNHTMEPRNCRHLLDLNDDCLLEILKHLTIGETFAVIGVVSRRLDEIAYRRIAALKHLDVSFRDLPSFSTAQLEVLGRNLKSVQLSVGYSISSDQVLRFLAALCKGAARSPLEELTLNYVDFSAAYCECLSGVAMRLQKVDFSFCQLTDELLINFLLNCRELRALRALGNYTLRGTFLQWPNLKMPKYIEIELHGQWTFPIDKLLLTHQHIQLTVYQKGRETFQQYGVT